MLAIIMCCTLWQLAPHQHTLQHSPALLFAGLRRGWPADMRAPAGRGLDPHLEALPRVPAPTEARVSNSRFDVLPKVGELWRDGICAWSVTDTRSNAHMLSIRFHALGTGGGSTCVPFDSAIRSPVCLAVLLLTVVAFASPFLPMSAVAVG